MAGILADRRVVDLSDSPAGAFAARWLAMLGADVVKVEPPGGDPARRRGPRHAGSDEGSALFGYLNAGKRSVVVADGEAGGQRLLALLRTADVVIETSRPGAWRERGIDFDALRARRPALVVCSVTPFGQDGPHAGWDASPLTLSAAGGQMMLCGDPDREPLLTAGHQAHYQGGLHAFSATLTALFAARRDGIGDHLDISVQEAQAASLEAAGPNALRRDVDAGRTGNQARAVWGIYPCADGFVGVAAMARQAPSVFRCVGHPELAADPRFSDLLANPEANELAAALIAEWTAARTAQQVFDESNEHRAPFSVIPTPSDLLEWPPLRDHGFWQWVEHPVLGRHAQPSLPFAIDGDRGTAARAPLLGEHTREVLDALERADAPPAAGAQPTPVPARLPLEGICVLDLTQIWAGPYATRFLADMGADVIHIEGPAFPDGVRAVGRAEHPRSYNLSAYFNEYNRNKRGMALDLHRPEGVDVVRRLVRDADVVIENWSVGVAERLGLGWDDLRAINPRVVFVQMPGFSQHAPEAERVGFGPTIEQMGGLVALQGYEGGDPHKSGISYGDPTAGTTAAGVVALALLQREATGRGAHAVVTQRDNIVSLVGEFIVAESAGLPYPVRAGNRSLDAAPHGVYRTRDDDPGRPQADAAGRQVGEFRDRWLALSVESDAAWSRFCRLLADPRLADARFMTLEGRLAGRAEIDAVVGDWAAPRDALEAARALQAAGIPAHPVMSPLMLLRDEHLVARGCYPTVHHPEVGEHRTMRPVWRLRERPLPPPRPAPCFGEHNRDVLREAGYADAEIDALERAGVLADAPAG